MSSPAPNANDLSAIAEQFLSTLSPGPLAVAVSGGSDSLGVLELIHSNNPANNPDRRKLYCFTVDHGIRKEAALEAEMVAEFCNERGITHKTLSWLDEKPSTGLQQAAREARYRLLSEACEAIGAIGLVTGHTLDDQIETVIMRQKRDVNGKGRGLSGMAPATLFNRNMWVLRPFLKTSRQDIRTYLSSKNLKWIEDPSNENRDFERVRIRQSNKDDFDIETIKKNASYRIEVSKLAAKYLRENINTCDGLKASLQYRPDHESATRVVEALVNVIGGRSRMPGSEQLEKLREFCQNPSDGRVNIGRVIVKKQKRMLFLSREARGFNDIQIAPLSLAIWDGRFLIRNKHTEYTLNVTEGEKGQGFPPECSWQDKPGVLDGEDFTIERSLNHFDQVLSLYDLELANAAADIFARELYLEPPFASN